MFYDTGVLIRTFGNGERCHEPWQASLASIREMTDMLYDPKTSSEMKNKVRTALQTLRGEYLEQFIGRFEAEVMAEVYRYFTEEKTDLIFYTDDFEKYVSAGKLRIPRKFMAEEKMETAPVGYKELSPTDDQWVALYSGGKTNIFDLEINQYAVLKNTASEEVACVKWNGRETVQIGSRSFRSKAFGKIVPLDMFQRCAFEALENHEFVVLYGRPGSGKTMLALGYLMQQIEDQSIRKLYVIGHFEPLKGSRQLGYMKGSKIEKQLTTGSLGNILTSKFGDESALAELLDSGAIEIISTSDLRGMEFGAEDAVFVTEAQDIDAYTTRTIIQRCKKGCKIVFEGDMEQIDIKRESGFEKMTKVFAGHPNFACAYLKNDHRSEFGVMADQIV